jgi:outer membrane protein assembly factor BamB
MWGAVCLIGLALASAACGTGGGTTTAPSATTFSPAVTPAGDWPAYHHDPARSGVSSDQLALGKVQQAWTSTPLDGALYAQPLVVGNRVLAATEGNTVYTLDAASGAIVWQTNLGEPVPGSELPCGNIDPSGITGTPVVDVASGTLYAVANLRSGPHHELFALELATGAVRWHRSIDPPGLTPQVEQERGALTLAGGRVYVPFGGLYGDCGQYKGAVVSAAADGSGSLTSYVVPTSRMAGIWNPAGPVVDTNGDLWVTTGNSESQGSFDYGNAVIRLSPQLTVLDYFAPTDWVALNAGDVDLGSLGPVLLPNGRALAVGKSGMAYLLDSGKLGQVGGELASIKIGSSAFGAAATTGSMVFVPCTQALVALRVTGDTIEVAWSVRGGAGPPIVAAGAVWSLFHDGQLKAVDPVTGTVSFSTQLTAPVSRFVSLSAVGGRLFVADGNRIAAFNLR